MRAIGLRQWAVAVLAVLAPPAWTAVGAATGLAFLKNGVDARSTILGEAVVSHVADASACYWNPAGLGGMERSQLLLSHVESFADLRHEYGAAVQPLGRVTAGLFFNGMWTNDIEGYDAQANRTGSFGFATYEVGVALGAPVAAGVRVGGALKYLNESIDTYSAAGWGADLGVQYDAGEQLGLGTDVEDPSLQLGAVVKHLGGSVSFIEEPVDLPLTFQGGVSSAIPLPRLSGRLVLALEGRHVRDDGTSMLFGGEYEYRHLLRFGAGYQTGRDTRDFSLGLGLRQGPLAFHWSFVPIKDDLGDEHRLTLGIDL